MDSVKTTWFGRIQEIAQSSTWYYLLVFGDTTTNVVIQIRWPMIGGTDFATRKFYSDEWSQWKGF